jgi:hypothetical protein
MLPASIGTPYNNLLLAVNEDSMVLRYSWDVEPLEQKSVESVTLEDVRAYFASTDRGMGIGPDDIAAIGTSTRPGVYPVMIRNMEDWHVACVRERIPDLPVGYNNELIVADGTMAIRFTC